MKQNVALQGTTLGGIGYAAAGDIHAEGDRNYRYGTTPQGLVAFRLILGNRAMVEMNAREYYISELNGSSPEGHELIGRANICFTVRVYGQHALGLQFSVTRRDSHTFAEENRHQTEAIVSLTYTFLGEKKFGAVEW